MAEPRTEYFAAQNSIPERAELERNAVIDEQVAILGRIAVCPTVIADAVSDVE